MKTRILVTIFLLTALFTFSVSMAAKAEDKIYGIQSGIIEYETGPEGYTMKQVVYFDQWGRREVREMYELGALIHTSYKLDDGWVYLVSQMPDGSGKSGTKMPDPSTEVTLDKWEEVYRNMGLTKTGTDGVLGRTCDLYTGSQGQGEMSTTTENCLWEGIPLRSGVLMNGVPNPAMMMKAVKIEENVPIPPQKLNRPTDIEYMNVEGMYVDE